MTGDDLILWRKRQGLTQRELARSLGVDVMTISRWERGIRGIPVLLPLSLEALEHRLNKRGNEGPKKASFPPNLEGSMDLIKIIEEGESKGVRIWFECQRCKVMWSAKIESGDWIPEGWWHCPKGCNLPKNLH